MLLTTPTTIFLLAAFVLVYSRPQTNDQKIKLEELAKNPYFTELFTAFLNQFQEHFTNSTTQQPLTIEEPSTEHYVSHIAHNPFISKTTQKPSLNPREYRVNTLVRQNFDEPTKINLRRRPVFVVKNTTTTEKPQKIVTIIPVSAPTPSKFDEELFKKQAENAKYEFTSEIDDSINGQLQQREEVRNGLAVKGKYAYDDGFFKRTVHYEADDKGYRVIKEEVEEVGKGPQFNPEGHAKVSQYVAGNSVNYEITKEDIIGKQKILFDSTVPQ